MPLWENTVAWTSSGEFQVQKTIGIFKESASSGKASHAPRAEGNLKLMPQRDWGLQSNSLQATESCQQHRSNWHQAVKLWMGNWHSALDVRISARGVAFPTTWRIHSPGVLPDLRLQRKLGGGDRGSLAQRLLAQAQEESCSQQEAVRTAGLGADNSWIYRACREPPRPGGVSAPQFHPAPPSALPASAGFPPAPAFAPTHGLPCPPTRRCSRRSIPPCLGPPSERCDPAPLRSPLSRSLPLPPPVALRASLKAPTRVFQPTREASAPATRPHPQGPPPTCGATPASATSPTAGAAATYDDPRVGPPAHTRPRPAPASFSAPFPAPAPSRAPTPAAPPVRLGPARQGPLALGPGGGAGGAAFPSRARPRSVSISCCARGLAAALGLLALDADDSRAPKGSLRKFLEHLSGSGKAIGVLTSGGHAQGMDHFLYGLSDEMKQAHREQLFTISHKKLLAMSDRYLGTGKSTHGLAILRPENPKIAKDPSWIIRPCGSVLLTDGSSTGRPDGSSPEKQVGWGCGPTRAAGPSHQHPCLLWQESSENSKLGPSKDRGLDWTRNWLSDFSNPHLGGFNMQLGLQSRGRVAAAAWLAACRRAASGTPARPSVKA
ncbi:uncharacterized protein [Chlorocebus sabaeus]|uniref:uncharacterized protein n=2 Tax=Chlorocebus sabaeus TaxID=60711 RepID=UPI003BF9889A